MLVERVIPQGLRDKSRRPRRALRPAVSAPRGTRSLDSLNHLATSDSETYAQWLKRHETAQDRRRKSFRTWAILLQSLKAAAFEQQYLEQVHEWDVAYLHAEREALGGAYVETPDTRPKGRKRLRLWKDFERVSACQTEWKGFRAACCDGRAVAVPIGCNHRLCPLCNAHRAEHYRERVKALFERIANPQLLTLTVPNCRKLTPRTIKVLRTRLKAFLKLHKGFLMGGVYSIEITRNRKEGTWHPHIHALVDVAGEVGKLPYWQFMERKWRLEFDWFLLTQGKRPGQRIWREEDYAEWVRALDPRVSGRSDARRGDRRSVDLRPVSTDKKAAYEVMKYMTKVAFFVDDPAAVAEFLTAVKGVRAIQTFGSCYGFKMKKKSAKQSLSCACGKNDWKDIGILGLGMVELSPEGRWYVRDDAPMHGRLARCRGGTTGKGLN